MMEYLVTLLDIQGETKEVTIEAATSFAARDVAARKFTNYTVLRVEATLGGVAGVIAEALLKKALSASRNPQFKLASYFTWPVPRFTRWLVDDHRDDLLEFLELMTPYGQAKATAKIVDQIWGQYH
jgi:hypothetical protein